MAWARRDRLRRLTPTPAFWWWPLLGVTALLWLLANLTSTTAIEQLCLGLMFVGFIWGILGTSAARELAFPLGFLVFAVPLGDYLVPSLQRVTARFAVNLLQMSGVPVLLNGEVISIPGSNWEVASACSGINYLMSALVMAYLYAGIAFHSARYRVLFFMSAAPVALFANGLRVYITILVAFAGAPRVASGLRHYVVGWAVFGIILAVMFVLSGYFREHGSARPRVLPSSQGRQSSGWMTALFAAVALIIVSVAPIAATHVLPVSSTPVVAATTEVSPPWRPLDGAAYSWSPRSLAASGVSAATYLARGRHVQLHILHYGPTADVVTLSSRERGLTGDGWSVPSSVKRTVMLRGRQMTVDETSIHSEKGSLLVWDWYWVGGASTSNAYLAKMLLARSRLFRSDSETALIVVATDNQFGADAASVLEDFLQHLTVGTSQNDR